MDADHDVPVTPLRCYKFWQCILISRLDFYFNCWLDFLSSELRKGVTGVVHANVGQQLLNSNVYLKIIFFTLTEVEI